MSQQANLQQCNPSTLLTTRTTCLPQEILLRLRNAWNERFPTHAIPTSIRRKDEIWAALRERLFQQYKCFTEFCALEELGDSGTKTNGAQYFRPSKPAEWTAKPRQWLDNTNISKVMAQYEAAFPHFEFIGPVPIDFDKILPGNWGKCVVDELCRLDISQLRRNGKRQIGVIFNLDPSDEPGSHWVCAFVDSVAGAVYFYDSYGVKPCPEIQRFIQRCRAQGCTKVSINTMTHQRKSTECGMYCLYIIIKLLQGVSFEILRNTPVDDDTIATLRDLLFATKKPSDRAIRDGVRILAAGG